MTNKIILLPNGYHREKDNSIWYDWHHIAGFCSSMEEAESKNRTYLKDGKRYCKTCDEHLEYKIEGRGCNERHFYKLCECLKPELIES